MKYKTIYADPPWMEHGGGKIQRGADRHYPLMKTKDIMGLPVQEFLPSIAVPLLNIFILWNIFVDFTLRL